MTSPGPSVTRIRFLPSAPAGVKVRRVFTQPRTTIAVEDEVSRADVPSFKPGLQPVDQLHVSFLTPDATDWAGQVESFLASSHGEKGPPLGIRSKTASIAWRAGRAVVQCAAENHDHVLTALTEFAFLEGELRSMEVELDNRSEGAEADLPRVFVVDKRDKQHWPRFAALIEAFTRMRIAFNRLEPLFGKNVLELSPTARRLLKRLLAKAEIEGRLESFDNRLEFCEELYEGATDRVADYRWYSGGHFLELTIVLLLIWEVIILLLDMYMNHS